MGSDIVLAGLVDISALQEVSRSGCVECGHRWHQRNILSGWTGSRAPLLSLRTSACCSHTVRCEHHEQRKSHHDNRAATIRQHVGICADCRYYPEIKVSCCRSFFRGPIDAALLWGHILRQFCHMLQAHSSERQETASQPRRITSCIWTKCLKHQQTFAHACILYGILGNRYACSCMWAHLKIFGKSLQLYFNIMHTSEVWQLELLLRKFMVGRFNPVHIFTTCFSKIHFNIAVPFMSGPQPCLH